MNTRLMYLFIFCLMSGCAITNEGAIDYRYSRPGEKSAAFNPKYISADEAENAIRKGDPLSVTLKQVYIKNLTEFKSPLRWARLEPATGDVAIVASICEGSCPRKFGAEATRASKVLYYSKDVREGQFLNISNLNGVYGPITYNGNPFKIDIYVIELDENGEQIRQLIGSLAGLGKTFYPPANPAATILTTLADTFIKDDQDDNVFSYSFDLVVNKKETGSANPKTAFLEAGDYILIRNENRLEHVPWESLAYNSNVGRVVFKKNNCETIKEPAPACYYTEKSYIVLGVNKADNPLSNDTQQIIYSALRDQINDASETKQISAEKLEALKKELTSTVIKSEASEALSNIRSSSAGTNERKQATLKFASICFDTTKYIAPHDSDRILDEVTKVLGRCSTLTSTERVLYQDEIGKRATSDKAGLIDALNRCP